MLLVLGRRSGQRGARRGHYNWKTAAVACTARSAATVSLPADPAMKARRLANKALAAHVCSNFLDTKDKAFWRALLGVVSLGVSIGLAALILRL